MYGKPQALIFQGRMYGKLGAWSWGACGYMERRVMNPEALYLKVLESKERRG